jgi:uncharacterized membrane protein
MNKRVKFLLWAQPLDAIFTFIGTNHLGAAVEGNPLVREVLITSGLGSIFAVKLMAIIAILWVWIHCWNRKPTRLMNFVLNALVFVYILAIVSWCYAFTFHCLL